MLAPRQTRSTFYDMLKNSLVMSFLFQIFKYFFLNIMIIMFHSNIVMVKYLMTGATHSEYLQLYFEKMHMLKHNIAFYCGIKNNFYAKIEISQQ